MMFDGGISRVSVVVADCLVVAGLISLWSSSLFSGLLILSSLRQIVLVLPLSLDKIFRQR